MEFGSTHPDYEATRGARVMSRDFYEGTAAVRAKGTTYLKQETNESDGDYQTRLARAVVDNYVEKIVVERQAYLWKKPPTRELTPALERSADNVDRQGTDADSFFREVTREAQIDGIRWVAADMPRMPDSGFSSLLEQEQAGHRFFFESIPGANVVDWSVDENGALLWAIIEQNTIQPREEPGGEAEGEVQYKVWTRKEWRLYEVNEASSQTGDTSTWTLVDSGGHDLGVVPLVPFLGQKHTAYSGWPVARPVLHHIALIYNKSSDMDWYERLSAHPVLLGMGPEKPEQIETTGGIWITDDGSAARPPTLTYLEPSGTALQTQRASISDLEDRIYAIALAQTKRETAQAQAADTLREDRAVFTASLAAAAVAYEKCEQRCWQLAATWAGEQAGRVSVEYHKDFNELAITPQMIQTLNALADSDRLTTQTLLQHLKQSGLLPEDFDVDEELRELEEQKAQSAATAIELFRQGQTEPESEEEDAEDSNAIVA